MGVFALPQRESGTISLLTPSSVQASDAVITQCLAWVRIAPDGVRPLPLPIPLRR